MLKQLKHIDTAFNHIRMFSIIVIVVNILISCYSIYRSFAFVERSQERIYILSNGKALEAWSAERKDNISVEARDHVRMFHYYFFTLHPDEKIIQANITKALYLADASAKRVYDDLKEKRFYSNIISGNISQEILFDSIRIDVSGDNVRFHCYARQKLIRTTSIVTRSLETEGRLRNVARSDHNPHGFLIEGWTTLQNKDIKTENR